MHIEIRVSVVAKVEINEKGQVSRIYKSYLLEFDMGFATGQIYSIFIEVPAHQTARYYYISPITDSE